MLPEALLHVDMDDSQVVPRFLSPRDTVWVRRLMDAVDGFVGRPAAELDDQTEVLLQQCARFGAQRRAAAGVLKVLSRAWARKVVACAKPAEVRRLVFELAASGRDRDDVLRTAAAELGIQPDQILDSLFADRAGQRRVQAPDVRPDPLQVVELYNLELVQGLLARSEHVAVLVRENVRSVVRYAKLKGLLCTYSVDGQGTMIELSGPLSLFHNTLKYGNALASFFPSVVVTPGWFLGATCLLLPPPWQRAPDDDMPRRLRLVLDASAPVRATHKLPDDADSAVERRLVRDVRRLRRGWDIERETTALRAGPSVFFPDFRLVRGEDRVLVEVVGYYTAAYLEAKLDKLRQAEVDRIIVCIDESLACEDREVTADIVLRYRRRVDAAALLDAADRLAGSTSSSPWPAGSRR